MHTWSLFWTLTANELTNVRRDSLLRWMAIMPVALALGLRWLVPVVDANIKWDLQPYYVLIMSGHCVFGVPVLIGFIVGMLLLDDRDDGTLQAMRVTPLSLGNYLAYKLTLPVVLAAVTSVICIPAAGLMEFRASLVPACLVGALWAPILALLMASFAKNKLQGFVLMRVSNVPVAAPFLAWFVTSSWTYAFGLLPSFWPLKAFWLAAEGQTSWPFSLVGTLFHLICVAWLVARFHRAMSRE